MPAAAARTPSDPRTVIYSWEAISEHRATRYEIIVRANGERSCDCPGYIYARKGQPRDCKHLRQLSQDIDRVYQLYTAGRPLPMNEVAAPTNQRSPAFTPGDTAIRLRPRRLITFE